MNQANFTPSPCIRKCGLNERDICRGCFRSKQEIIDWERMSETDKKATVERAQQRRAERIARLRI